MFLVSVFYLLAFFKFFAWTVLSLLAREWSQVVWEDKIFVLRTAVVGAPKKTQFSSLTNN